jgi:glycosyltransferase involved in cell wall biosynthesis
LLFQDIFPEMIDGISVVICCHNSASRLPLTLGYLGKQKTNPDLNWEIILVDNNSKDDTATTAKRVWSEEGDEHILHIVDEKRAGLSYAREAGVNAAKYSIVIFCDDDNLLADNYLETAWELVNRTEKYGYGVWGGRPVAYFEHNTSVPDWFEKEKSNYVVGQQGTKTGDISSRGYVWGAGMIILRDLFLKVTDNKFPLLLTGRKNDVLSAGDDSEICLRALILGYKLYYDSSLVLKHYIPANRLTPDYNAALVKGFHASNEIINKYRLFIYYIADKNALVQAYYRAVYKSKYFLDKLHVRKLTSYDSNVIKALHKSGKLPDPYFDAMWKLYALKKSC